MTPKPVDDLFDTTWKKLSKRGSCDGFGGAEYERVRSEYEACRVHVADDQIGAFIRLRANIGPTELREARQHWGDTLAGR